MLAEVPFLRSSVAMMTVTSVLRCFRRMTSSLSGLHKSISTASNQPWLTGFQSRPLLAAATRCLPQKATATAKFSNFCGGHDCQKSLFSWPRPTFCSAEVSKVAPSPQAATIPVRGMASLKQMHMTGIHYKDRKKKRPLDGNPFLKGVVLKTLIKKPKKPNSANRRCVLVRMSNGKEAVAHVPGEGHNLQEHNIVLVRVGRLQDVPGVRLKVVRGKYDCAHVIKRTQLDT